MERLTEHWGEGHLDIWVKDHDYVSAAHRLATDLRLEAMHQRGRFGRNLLATELEEAAATIKALAEKLEAKE